MTQLIAIDRATLEQLVAALNEVDQHVDLKRYDTAPNEVLFDVVMEAMVKGRAALANAEPTGFSLTNTSISDTSRTIESFFEAMDKEVAAGRLVRTGPMEWTKL